MDVLSLIIHFCVLSLFTVQTVVRLCLEGILTYIAWSATNHDEYSLCYGLDILSRDVYQTQVLLWTNLHEQIQMTLNLKQFDFIILPSVGLIYQLCELLTIIITLFIVISLLRSVFGVWDYIFGKKPSIHQNSLHKVNTLLSQLGPDKKERLVYYQEHLEGLIESIEEDIKK